mmetsp:Transcript_13788/g.29739  ORF Transcript_13788/g.29739 Transcript_13788/m.29739 type:complete len:574 (+) Transcript_13788:188-1909(+)|eukprot:CAMPEP_0202903036 /NCGR_PEP_ID=MMETSP1392-20130828/20444_1 /ASSEMBLY_ACC=CAM_ASM_000868 /TAXON_ID=225041 /ORGANISM="Chlamydomonas chlamydogama, Strain SAG 11-48b" /LENGTH=573 /DNA_ID=CAMNT_0049589991 /DNA_START=168 /DNA_END=1889 /DNA_ORIENTATION=+
MAIGVEPHSSGCQRHDSGVLSYPAEGEVNSNDAEVVAAEYSDDLSEDTENDDTEEDYYGSRFCINCTGRMFCSDVCEDCGHHAATDSELFRSSHNAGATKRSQSDQDDHVALIWDDRMAMHEECKASPHPERPDRIRAVVARILASGVGGRCRRVPCREASIEELQRVHTTELVDFVKTVGEGRPVPAGTPLLMTSDSYVNAHTFHCARLAAGGSAEVASLVACGQAPHGAAIVRPPGHHAESGMAMGFCFFNNAAVAAKAAQASGAKRVLILDWDIHHGNGTQHIFEDDPSVLYVSLHRYDGGRFYPGTGGVEEVGVGAGEGFSVNIPWDASDMGNGDYMAAFHHVLLPISYEFNPDLIIVSAGFDAAEGDPIGECRLTPECYAHMTSMLKAVAPVVLLLEGGYNLRSTAVSTEACLRVLLGEPPASLPGMRYPSAFGWQAIQRCIQVQAQYWQSLVPAFGALAMQQSADLKGLSALGATSSLHQTNVSTVSSDAAYASEDGDPPSADTSNSSDVSDRHGPTGAQRKRKAQQHLSLSRKRQILLTIHRRAMRAFWKKQRQVLAQQEQQRASM